MGAVSVLVGLGAVVGAGVEVAHAADPVITAPDIVFGPSASTGIPVPFTGTDPISSDLRTISIAGPDTSACAPTAGNSYDSDHCSSVKLELQNDNATISIPNLTDLGQPTPGLWRSPAGALFNQDVPQIVNMFGTVAQINGTLSTLSIVPKNGYERTDSATETLTITALAGPLNGGTGTVQHDVDIRIEGINDFPDLTVPSGAFPVVAGTADGYVSNASDFTVTDSDIDHGELDDDMLLIMVATCGEFHMQPGGLPYTDDLHDLLTKNNELNLPGSVADAIIAALPDEVKNATFGTESTGTYQTAFAGAGGIDEVNNALSAVTFRDTVDDQSCKLYTVVSDLGNNGLPVSYVGSPPAGFPIPIPGVDFGTTKFVIGAGATPQATIDEAAAQADPTSTAPIHFTVTFDTDVTGFAAADVSLGASTAGGTLTATVSGGPAVYDVAVSGMTTAGNVVATVAAGAVNAADAPNNPSAAAVPIDNSVAWTDTVAPTVTLEQAAAQPDPTSTSPIHFTATFSEPVTGFDGGDITFPGTTAGGTLVATVSGSGAVYDVAVSGMTTDGDVKVAVPAAAAIDGSSNPSAASTSIDRSVTWQASVPVDTTAPTVTIDQAVTQVDPTSVSPINFTVTFSEPVIGFTAADVDLSTSTVGGSLVAVATGGPSVWNIAVAGMTTAGNVTATIPAAAATDAALNASTASTSTDNTVAWQVPPADTTAPTVTIDQAVTQVDPTSVSPINFTVTFSEPVIGFTAADVDLSTSTVGGSLVAVATGGPSVWNIAVAGMTTAGNVTATIPAAAATDAALNASTASTSTDNTIAFTIVAGDTTPPTLNVPANITVFNDPGQAGAIVNYPAPTATDASPPVAIHCTSAAGAFFALGVTTVSCTATDSASGIAAQQIEAVDNSITASFTITVVDNEPPVIQPKPDISVQGPAGGMVVTFTPPTATDNSGVAPAVACTPLPGGLFPFGATTVTCTATDGAGNSASTSFRITVTVNDATLPATGTDTSSWLRSAALLVLAGLATLFAVRRRRHTGS